MKILLTGGAGFIGSNLCDHFIAKNYKVVCLDNLATSFKSNLDEIIDHPNFTFIEGDIPHSQASIFKPKPSSIISHNIQPGRALQGRVSGIFKFK